MPSWGSALASCKLMTFFEQSHHDVFEATSFFRCVSLLAQPARDPPTVRKESGEEAGGWGSWKGLELTNIRIRESL